MEGVSIPTSVIIVAIIISVIIVALTIAHITGGYRIKQTIDDPDMPIDTDHNSTGERDSK